MTFDELVDFIKNRMRMSHIYQPLLIRSLLDAGGTATLRQLAHAFLGQDESQLRFYEQRIKEMPLRVLSRHGVVQRDGEVVSLATRHLTFEEASRLRMLCEMKMQEFIQRRGLSLWDYRLGEDEPVPDSLRYMVLKAAGGRCALCGATRDERPLDVDHILPRSGHGKTELANLQGLCSKCNRSKRNKDATDFRELSQATTDPSCPFCDPSRVPGAVESNQTVFAVEDLFPVSTGHMLVIPFRHTPDFFSMTGRERQDAESLLRYLRNKIVAADASVLGFNVGANCGLVAGQTVMHAHLHLIPRRERDTPDPSGGIRGVIPGRMNY